jgi:hypothetical protein
MRRTTTSSCGRLGAAVALVLTAGVVWAAPAAAQQQPAPYADPPWAAECTFHEFGEGEAPAPGSLEDDPLCVRYAKEDITVDDGGALAFLAAEPARVLAAVPACRYWQQDRWSVQVSEGTTAVVAWEGSYWFDRGAGTGGAVLRDFRLAGQPAGAGQLADLLEPLSSEWAEALRAYEDGAGGGGMSFELGGGDPTCATSAAPPGGDDPPPGGQPAPPGAAALDPAARTLPVTGAAALVPLGGALLALFGAVLARERRQPPRHRP